MMQSSAGSTSLIQNLSFKYRNQWQARAILLAFESGWWCVSKKALVMLAMVISISPSFARHDCLNF